MIWTVCACFATADRPAWTLRRASTVTTSSISGECSKPVRWMCSSRMQLVAPGSPASSRRQPLLMRLPCQSRRTPRPRSTSTPAAQFPALDMSNISTITLGSRKCFLTVPPNQLRASLCPIYHDRGWAWNSAARMPNVSASVDQRSGMGPCPYGRVPKRVGQICREMAQGEVVRERHCSVIDPQIAVLEKVFHMAHTAADALVQTLIDWGVEIVFGLPGDGINGIMESLRTHKDQIRFIQVRHEEAAAFMACGYAKYTGKLGVCVATSGPGAIHLLNGLYDAKLDGAPVLAITGQTYHDLLGTRYQQEVDLLSLFKDVAVYNQQVMGAVPVRNLVDAACRTALSEHGVAHLTWPIDIQEEEVAKDEPSKKNVEGHSAPRWTPPIVVPRHEDLERAALVLNDGQKTVILAGQ